MLSVALVVVFSVTWAVSLLMKQPPLGWLAVLSGAMVGWSWKGCLKAFGIELDFVSFLLLLMLYMFTVLLGALVIKAIF